MRVCWLCLLGWLGAPGVRGRCRQPRKQSLLWLSCYLREPLLKKLHYPICSLSLSHRLFTSTFWSRFGHSCGIYPLFDPFFFPWNCESWAHSEIWSPHLGHSFTSLWNHFSIQANLDHQECAMATMRYLILQWLFESWGHLVWSIGGES